MPGRTQSSKYVRLRRGPLCFVRVSTPIQRPKNLRRRSSDSCSYLFLNLESNRQSKSLVFSNELSNVIILKVLAFARLRRSTISVTPSAEEIIAKSTAAANSLFPLAQQSVVYRASIAYVLQHVKAFVTAIQDQRDHTNSRHRKFKLFNDSTVLSPIFPIFCPIWARNGYQRS